MVSAIACPQPQASDGGSRAVANPDYPRDGLAPARSCFEVDEFGYVNNICNFSPNGQHEFSFSDQYTCCVHCGDGR